VILLARQGHREPACRSHHKTRRQFHMLTSVLTISADDKCGHLKSRNSSILA
jgi:hypothetical protein